MMPLRTSLQRAGLALLLLVPLVLAALLWPQSPSDAHADVAPRNVASASLQGATLVAATTGEASVDMRAVGNDAQSINASLPYAGGPNPAAARFAGASAGTRDHGRAHLCLTQAIYYEAGFEPVQGRRAVAQVVLNRVKHPAFPASVCGVVYQGARQPVCQFSFTCDGSLNRAPAASAWARAKDIAAEALSGRVEPSVGMATHYHADYVAPKWAPMLAKVETIGTHIFYRWPGSWGRPGAFTERYIGEPAAASALRPADRIAMVEELVEVAPPPKPKAHPTREEDPTIYRAENDVGGLVDTRTGWRPSMPDPTKTSGARARIEFQQTYNAGEDVGPSDGGE
ncbi:cell wall hydrolase [Sphingomicrobium sediminis]|uniref:Cell wall hydrolase n=1 Tax=Sphingomicrobium sediminis TaxID=2950949 RepID=A0A9X2J3S9_9SPHN|nr:cell wall hydrolase [Sphingomicrobium sediminis]MCM8558385.1 cell wall hydrolase [Sphingomicrobium sediminis]